MRRVALLVVALVGLGCPAPERATPVHVTQETTTGPSDYDAMLARLDRAIEARTREADAHASWRRESTLATALLARADLTGDYRDYEAVEAHLARAFELARDGSGPHLVRARFLLRLHRVDEARADLATIATYAAAQPEVEAMRMGLEGDIAMSEGRFDDALATFTELVARDPSAPNLARLAHHAAKTGAPDRADGIYVAALSLAEDAQTSAWLELQRGLLDLDRDRLDEADAHYDAAAKHFSGWWLVEEHMAEVDAKQGRTAPAIAAYRDLVARTSNPELMDALAEALRPTAPAEAAEWSARARAEYERRLARFPAATYGHALEHFLAADDGAARSLELARANQRVRPGPDADALLARAEARVR